MKKVTRVLGIGFLCGSIVFVNRVVKDYKRKVDEITKDRDKIWHMLEFTNKWLQVKIAGNDVENYLRKKSYKNIAIYGMSNLGQTLISDLEDSSISIKYGIDRDAEVYWDTFPIITPDEIAKYDFSEVDAVIVTAITFFEEIQAQLSKELQCPIISLESII